MKIKKVTACETLLDASPAALESPLAEEAKIECKYQDAIQLIKGAIDCLAVNAKGDEVALDSIANLSVVLLDLKGSC